MSLCVLFGLLFCCLACFREGVWTRYTRLDVARWQAHTARQTPATPTPGVFPAPAARPIAADPPTKRERVEELSSVG